MLILALSGCAKKSEDVAPDKRLAILVNGHPWNYNELQVGFSTKANGMTDIMIVALNKDGSYFACRRYIPAILEKTPLIHFTNSNRISYIDHRNAVTREEYYDGCDDGNGFIEITAHDPQNRTISGKYYSTLCSAWSSGKPIKVVAVFDKLKYW